jgi:hypothetical protein
MLGAFGEFHDNKLATHILTAFSFITQVFRYANAY